MISSFDIITKKKEQDKKFLEKIKPENYLIIKEKISKFDSKYSLLRILRENKHSYESVKTAFQNFLDKREAYISKIFKDL